MSTERKKTKNVTGQVVSSTMDKTIVVSAERFVKHPRYGKYIKKSTKYKAHDEANTARVGDKVTIEEARPISKTKRWKLVTILTRSPEE